jgi:hypothetical protein
MQSYIMITYLLEGELLKVVVNSGDRKASSELLRLAGPFILAGSSWYGKSDLRVVGWLAGILKRNPQQESTSREERNKPKPESKGQQTRAGTLSTA